MVVLRLSRIGKKNHATFRLIVSEQKKDTHGTYLEQLGVYDPHQTPARLELNSDRIKHWLSVGAQPSDTVFNLLVEKGIVPGPKRQIVRLPKAQPAPAAATPAPAETSAAPVTPAKA